jgi:hypothetical protein
MAIKKIKATSEQWGLDFDFILEYDTDVTTEYHGQVNTLEENLKLSLGFFTGGSEVLEDSDGDVYIAYARFIGQKVVTEAMTWNVDGIIRQFENAEGYMGLDGSTGVKLVRADDFQIEDEFSAVEIS